MTIFLASLLLAAGPADEFDSLQSAGRANGQWVYSVGVGRFSPYVSIRCDRGSGKIQLIAPGYSEIATDSAIVALPADGWFAARDARLDAIAFSRARFVLRGGGRAPIAIPAEPEAARSIEDCRN